MRGYEVQVVTHRRGLGRSARDYARDKVAHLGRYTPRPVLYARVELDQLADPSVERRALAKATLDVNGHQLRAHATAGQPREAVDLLVDRLRHQLGHLSSQLRARRRAAARTRRGR